MIETFKEWLGAVRAQVRVFVRRVLSWFTKSESEPAPAPAQAQALLGLPVAPTILSALGLNFWLILAAVISSLVAYHFIAVHNAFSEGKQTAQATCRAEAAAAKDKARLAQQEDAKRLQGIIDKLRSTHEAERSAWEQRASDLEVALAQSKASENVCWPKAVIRELNR